ncbi:MAG: hypothetical protein ACK4QP_07410 [Pseudorhizobium sp.]
MPKNTQPDAAALNRTWTLPPAATFGSSVRTKGILLEIRARLPMPVRKSLDYSVASLVLSMPEESIEDFRHVSDIVSRSLAGIEDLPIIPREIEDILSISTTERHRWLSDGRLTSAGTRTVKLRGRARQITFHVFDPRLIKDLLDSGVVEEWREHDVETAAENRRRAAWKAKLTRSLKKGNALPEASANGEDEAAPPLAGWDDFGLDGLLR